MNEKNQTTPNPKSSLIDRRFFLKKSSAAVAVVTAGSLIATSAMENQIPVTENNTEKIPVATGDNNEPNKQWKAGWMAF